MCAINLRFFVSHAESHLVPVSNHSINNMSAFDYSKFDKIVDSDEEEEAAAEAAASHAQEGSQVLHSRPIGPALPPGPVPPVPTPPPGSTESVDPEFAQKMAMAGCRSAGKLTEKGTEKGRYKFMHQGGLSRSHKARSQSTFALELPPHSVCGRVVARPVEQAS